MSRKILGLDIRQDAVCAVLLKSSMKGISIESHAYASFSDLNNSEINLDACLNRIAEKMDLAGSVCIASIPAEQFSYRNIQVPFKEKKKIRQILPYELEPTVPFPVDDLIIDFYTLPTDTPDEHTDLVVVAIEQNRLNSYLEKLIAFHMDPKIVTAGGFALASYITGRKDSQKNYLFIDVGINICTLYLVAAGRICFVRSSPLRTSKLSGARDFCTYIQQTVAACGDIFHRELTPDQILLAGPGLGAADAEKDLALILDLPVERVDLITIGGVAIAHAGTPVWEPDRMDNALALARLETEGTNVLNFRKGPFARRKQWVEHKKDFIKTGVLAGAVLALMGANALLDGYYMKKNIARLDAQIEKLFTTAFPDIKKIVDPLHQMKVQIQTVRKDLIIQDASTEHIRNIDLLNDIGRLIPASTDIELSRVVIGPGSMLISGDTDTFNSVNEIKHRLEAGSHFQTVTINSANIEKTGNRVSFKLNIQIP